MNDSDGRGCQAMRRFSSNSTTVLTIEYGMPIFIDIPNFEPSANRCEPSGRTLHRARAVDLLVAGRVGEEVEDRARPERG